MADALPRKDMYPALSVCSIDEAEDWLHEVQQDPKWNSLVEDLVINPTAHSGYSSSWLVLVSGQISAT